MSEINLLDRYPKSNRPIKERGELVTAQNRSTARLFGKEYFDGQRLTGYGGYSYHPRFWQETVKRFRDYYNLRPDASILDVGCAKGFMLNDFKALMPDLKITGLDVSSYALDHALENIRPYLVLGDAKSLPFADKSFDLVISINTIHNLALQDCKKSLKEIQRVTKKDAFITVDAWRNDEEKENMLKWNLTALTYMSTDDWKKLFLEVGYKGDYFWFIP